MFRSSTSIISCQLSFVGWRRLWMTQSVSNILHPFSILIKNPIIYSAKSGHYCTIRSRNETPSPFHSKCTSHEVIVTDAVHRSLLTLDFGPYLIELILLFCDSATGLKDTFTQNSKAIFVSFSNQFIVSLVIVIVLVLIEVALKYEQSRT